MILLEFLFAGLAWLFRELFESFMFDALLAGIRRAARFVMGAGQALRRAVARLRHTHLKHT